jgi:hypothetical protein
MMKIIFGIACAALLCGCGTPVPGNRIAGNFGGVPFEINNPKNFSGEGLEISAMVGTNYFSMKFDRFRSENDPEVIDKSYAGRAAEVKEWFTGVNGLAGKLAEGAAKGASPAP